MPLPDEIDVAAFARSMQRLFEDLHALADDRPPAPITTAIREHLGAATETLEVVDESYTRSDHPNVQLALDAMCAATPGARVLGLPVEATHWSGFGLPGLANPSAAFRMPFDVIAPAYVNVPVDVDRTLPCVALGIFLLEHDGAPLAVLVTTSDPHRDPMNKGLKIEVMARTRDAAVAFLHELRRIAHERNVYRGKVLSFTFDEWGHFGLEFHRLPAVTRDDVVLPDEDLDAIERHAIHIAARADALRASGRHVKRGLLLYGPPGTGKTFSIMYLCNRMAGRTTLLLSGQAAPTLGQAAAMARTLQPSTLVLEDVDLVAGERTMPTMAGSTPLLFQLLNEMDGLAEDADVLFVLTTNRVDLLEPALADRPGRIDQAVEIRLPDGLCRERLLRRYLRGVGDGEPDLGAIVERTGGVSAAFIKELCRRATMVALDTDDGRGPVRVTVEHLGAALDDLLDHGAPALRRLLGARPTGAGIDADVSLDAHGGWRSF